MDADTYVCKPLTGAVCGVGGGYDVAFVPVREGKEHAKSVLAASPRWRVPAAAREANTGVVAWANTTKSRALVSLWLEAYDDLLEQSGFLMDQPAFRAALHATGAKSRHLHSSQSKPHHNLGPSHCHQSQSAFYSTTRPSIREPGRTAPAHHIQLHRPSFHLPSARAGAESRDVTAPDSGT